MSLSRLKSDLLSYANTMMENEYSSSDILSLLVRAIGSVPQLRFYEGKRVHNRSSIRWGFDAATDFDSYSGVTINKWASGSGSITSKVLDIERITELEDLLVMLMECNTSGSGEITFDLSVDQGDTWQVSDGILPYPVQAEQYIDVSGLVKTGIQIQWNITDTSGFKVHDTKAYFTFLPSRFVLEFGDVIYWQAQVNLLEKEMARARGNGVSDLYIASLENEIHRLQGLSAGMAGKTQLKEESTARHNMAGRGRRGAGKAHHDLAKKVFG